MSPEAEPLVAEVVAAEYLCPTVRRIVLGGPELAAFRVTPAALGPYLKLLLPGAVAGGAPVTRTYSVRRFDRATGLLTIDVVLRGAWSLPAAPTGFFLLAGDDTALPAIGFMLEHLPETATGHVVLEVREPSLADEIGHPGFSVTVLVRPNEAAPSALAQAVRDVDIRVADPLVWAGAEALAAREIRRHARLDRGIPRERCLVLNYWKRGGAEGAFSFTG